MLDPQLEVDLKEIALDVLNKLIKNPDDFKLMKIEVSKKKKNYKFK